MPPRRLERACDLFCKLLLHVDTPLVIAGHHGKSQQFSSCEFRVAGRLVVR
jgi:hypothetical protein